MFEHLLLQYEEIPSRRKLRSITFLISFLKHVAQFCRTNNLNGTNVRDISAEYEKRCMFVGDVERLVFLIRKKGL